jgi:hypothetical protein
MKKLILMGTLICALTSFSQKYWQQTTNYKLNVSLNDVNHELTAFEEIDYINNSPDTLKSLYFHLWPNAYRNKKTALAKQLMREKLGSNNTALDNPEFNGYIDSLDFKVNGQKTVWNYDKKKSRYLYNYTKSTFTP